MKKIRNLVFTVALLLGVVALVPHAALAQAPCPAGTSAVDCIGKGQEAAGGKDNPKSIQDQVKTVTNVLLFVLGAVAVIMIIIGGIRYATSNGESGNIKSAKDTILYAVVGLIVAILAYAIVNFVVGAFVK